MNLNLAAEDRCGRTLRSSRTPDAGKTTPHGESCCCSAPIHMWPQTVKVPQGPRAIDFRLDAASGAAARHFP